MYITKKYKLSKIEAFIQHNQHKNIKKKVIYQYNIDKLERKHPIQ